MHHKIYVVDQYPLRLFVAFDVVWVHPGALEPEFHFVRNRLYLARIRPAADDEVVGECPGIFVQLKNNKFLCLFFIAGVDRSGDLGFELVRVHSKSFIESFEILKD